MATTYTSNIGSNVNNLNDSILSKRGGGEVMDKRNHSINVDINAHRPYGTAGKEPSPRNLEIFGTVDVRQQHFPDAMVRIKMKNQL